MNNLPSTLPSSLVAALAAKQQYIESVDDERDTGDGYWVYLRPGYVFDSSTTFIHESTVADVKKALSRIGKVQP